MVEKRFPNSVDIAALREKGKVAISIFACRLFASLCTVCFLYKSKIPEKLRELLLFSEIGDEILSQGFRPLIETVTVAILVYITSYALAVLFQTRFYVSLKRVFKRDGGIFQLNRIYSFCRGSAIAFVACIMCIVFVELLTIRVFFNSLLGLIDGANLQQSFDILFLNCYKFSLVIATILIFSIFIAVIYSRINFLYLHRVKVKRG